MKKYFMLIEALLKNSHLMNLDDYSLSSLHLPIMFVYIVLFIPSQFK